MRWRKTIRQERQWLFAERDSSRPQLSAEWSKWRFPFEGVSGIVRHAVFIISNHFSHHSFAPGKALDRIGSGRGGGAMLALGVTGKPSEDPRPSPLLRDDTQATHFSGQFAIGRRRCVLAVRPAEASREEWRATFQGTRRLDVNGDAGQTRKTAASPRAGRGKRSQAS